MEHLPLTRPAEWTEIPAGSVDVVYPEDTLWPELAPPALRSFEVLLTVPDGGRRRTVADIVASRADMLRALATAFEMCESLEDFELTARRYRG